MSLPQYSPKKPILASASYTRNLARYGKAPEGYRWLKNGERCSLGDVCANGNMKKFSPVFCVGTVMDDNFWPHARKLLESSTSSPSLNDKIASLRKEIAALNKKVYEMTAETNKVVAEQRQKSEDLKVLLAAAKILNKES